MLNTSLSSTKSGRLKSFYRRRGARELLIFTALAALSAVMMWPWVLHLHDAMSDRGDAYAIVYWLWWDFHQTFHNPINLFHATAFYPYQYTMAFTENDYGVALLYFPLFALGLRPMTVHSIATFMAFPFAGYGMFRLARTLTGRVTVSWIAAITFAFIPYHFQRLPHLHLLYTGWIPLLLEALVLFARQRSWRRAVWLSIVFIMNALTAITWFILTLTPLVFSIVLLVFWYRLIRDRAFWIRGATALLIAAAVLMPFLLPYYHVHKMYGFMRTAADVKRLSAYPIHWLAASGRNKLWAGLGGAAAFDELTLFPGFLPPLFALAAIFLLPPLKNKQRGANARQLSKPRPTGVPSIILATLAVVALTFIVVALLTIGYGSLHLRMFGAELFRSSDPVRPLLFCVMILIVLSLMARPAVFGRLNTKGWISAIRTHPFSLALLLASIWGLTGFMGSFGMHFIFHRTLYRFVPLFTSLRAPVRWSMICYVGLALLAGIGADRIVDAVRRGWPRLSRPLLFSVVALLFLFEQRVAPIEFVRGEIEPDAISQRLKATRMSGGIVELPAEKDNYAYYRYMLRAADHGRPFVTASASFAPPIVQEIESLTSGRPIPDRLQDVLEAIPVSYLVVHRSLLNPETNAAIEVFVARAIAKGRLRFINAFGDEKSPDELYAITKIEPNATQEVPRVTPTSDFFVRQQYLDILGREPSTSEIAHWAQDFSKCQTDEKCADDYYPTQDLELFRSTEFENSGGLVFNLYRVALGRDPVYNEWTRDRKQLQLMGWDAFIGEWMRRPDLFARYPERLTTDEFRRNRFTKTAPGPTGTRKELAKTDLNRAQALLQAAKGEAPTIRNKESFVRLCYFIYLNRDADREGLGFWLQHLNQADGEIAVIKGLLYSKEYQNRFTH
jgi:hypothetical protein